MLKLNPQTGETMEISLFDLLDGGVRELAQLSLDRVLENIRDLNTEAKKQRKITVEFKFVPGDDAREEIDVQVQVKTTLEPVRPVKTKIDVGTDGDKVVCMERPRVTPGQLMLGTQTQADANTNIYAFANEA